MEQSIKETAANIAASAISGKEKTKATLEEKVEKATAHDPIQKEMATQKKQERIRLAELDKQQAYHQNAAVRQSGRDEGYTAKGSIAKHSTKGGQQMSSALPAQVVEGRVEVHLVGTNPGVADQSTPHNTRVEGNPNMYGTGGNYS